MTTENPIEVPRIAEARERVAEVARRTELAACDLAPPEAAGGGRVELRLKLECTQETGSFKVRGAWNQVSRLTPGQRAAGVVATSSGNHGRALSWAAARAGVHAAIVMPADAYPNKIAACRDLGAEVVLGRDRADAERICAERVAAGAVLVHPYDAERTVQGAGTVGLEIAEDWPEVDLVLVPVGGGGLLAGVALALRQSLGTNVRVVGVEPEGAPTMTRALEAGGPVTLDAMTTAVQGLCPPHAGRLNERIVREHVDAVVTVADDDVFAAQLELVECVVPTVEPAGAAALAALRAGRVPSGLLEPAPGQRRVRVAAIVSGGNPDPAQLAALRGETS